VPLFQNRALAQIFSYENEFDLTCRGNTFSYEWFCTRTRFDTDAKGNELECARFVQKYQTILNIVLLLYWMEVFVLLLID